MKKKTGKVVIGQVCPHCFGNVDPALHEMWEINKSLHPGKSNFAPFGSYQCPSCGKPMFVQLYGDTDGFVSWLFDTKTGWQVFCDEILKQLIEKGVSAKAVHLVQVEMFGLKENQGVVLPVS